MLKDKNLVHISSYIYTGILEKERMHSCATDSKHL